MNLKKEKLILRKHELKKKKKTPSGESTDLQRYQKYTKVQYTGLRQLINTCELV